MSNAEALHSSHNLHSLKIFFYKFGFSVFRSYFIGFNFFFLCWFLALITYMGITLPHHIFCFHRLILLFTSNRLILF
jgi:hypothetical protein